MSCHVVKHCVTSCAMLAPVMGHPLIRPGGSESSLQHGETVLCGTGRAATNLGPRVSTSGTNTSAGSTGICTATGMATILRWDGKAWEIGSFLSMGGTPIAGWFITENPSERDDERDDDWGVPL